MFLLLDHSYRVEGGWAHMVDGDLEWIGDLCSDREVEADMVTIINRGFGEVLAFIKARPSIWKTFLKRARRRHALKAQSDRLGKGRAQYPVGSRSPLPQTCLLRVRFFGFVANRTQPPHAQSTLHLPQRQVFR